MAYCLLLGCGSEAEHLTSILRALDSILILAKDEESGIGYEGLCKSPHTQAGALGNQCHRTHRPELCTLLSVLSSALEPVPMGKQPHLYPLMLTQSIRPKGEKGLCPPTYPALWLICSWTEIKVV